MLPEVLLLVHFILAPVSPTHAILDSLEGDQAFVRPMGNGHRDRLVSQCSEQHLMNHQDHPHPQLTPFRSR